MGVLPFLKAIFNKLFLKSFDMVKNIKSPKKINYFFFQKKFLKIFFNSMFLAIC